jgi:hypothetical protein
VTTGPEKARGLLTPIVGIYEPRHADAHLASSDVDEAFFNGDCGSNGAVRLSGVPPARFPAFHRCGQSSTRCDNSQIEPFEQGEERRTMGDLWFRQEYGCEFVDAVSRVFDRDVVERAVREEVRPLEI